MPINNLKFVYIIVYSIFNNLACVENYNLSIGFNKFLSFIFFELKLNNNNYLKKYRYFTLEYF